MRKEGGQDLCTRQRQQAMRYRKIHCLLPVFAVVVSACSGCVTGQLIAAKTSVSSYTINAPRGRVFDVALVVSQSRNLNVAVLEKQSGLIRFEAASLSALDLDKYCNYPYINPNTGGPWDTFTNWNQRSLNAGTGPVNGKMSITLLITDRGSKSDVNLRSNWVSYNRTETTPCRSSERFEREFVNDIKRTLLP